MSRTHTAASTPQEALDVVAFWHEAGPKKWFAKDGEFDRAFYDRFIDLHERAARGELGDWQATPDGVLALCILLDQFPRNSFRGTPRMFATDAEARVIADRAVLTGMDKAIDPQLRVFIYLPFEHSENLTDQERCVALSQSLGGDYLKYAKEHRDIIARFGRFPHRNPILGREMRPEEQEHIDKGGFAG